MSRPSGKIWRIAAVFAAAALCVVGVHKQRGCERTPDWTTTAMAQEEFVVEDVAEKTVTELPAGPLYWRRREFPRRGRRATRLVRCPWPPTWRTGLALYAGSQGDAGNGGSMVTEIGPLVDVSAPEYLLAVSHGVAAPGAKSGVHASRHRGVLGAGGSVEPADPARRERCRGQKVWPGPRRGSMEVTSSGGEELQWLIMFVWMRSKPFASDATFR